MRYLKFGGVLLFMFAVLAAPAVAKFDTYRARYAELVDRSGVQSAGCNLVTDKYDNRCHGKTTRADVKKSNVVLKRLLYVPPPPPPPAPVTHAATAAPATSQGTGSVASASSSAGNTASGSGYAGGNYAIPTSIVMCESGGDYNARNSSSGAYGAYQILPSTSAGLGCNMATPAGQDECARRVWATQGRGAWVC